MMALAVKNVNTSVMMYQAVLKITIIRAVAVIDTSLMRALTVMVNTVMVVKQMYQPDICHLKVP